MPNVVVLLDRRSGGEYEKINYSWLLCCYKRIGPVALKGTRNHVGGWGENSTQYWNWFSKSHSEINLSIAF